MSRFLAPDPSIPLMARLIEKLIYWEAIGLYPGDLLFTRMVSALMKRDTIACISLLEFLNSCDVLTLVRRHYLVGVFGKPLAAVLQDTEDVLSGNGKKKSYRAPQNPRRF